MQKVTIQMHFKLCVYKRCRDYLPCLSSESKSSAGLWRRRQDRNIDNCTFCSIQQLCREAGEVFQWPRRDQLTPSRPERTQTETRPRFYRSKKKHQNRKKSPVIFKKKSSFLLNQAVKSLFSKVVASLFLFLLGQTF